MKFLVAKRRFLLAGLILFSSSCFLSEEKPPEVSSEQKNEVVAVSSSNVNLTKPLEVSQKPEDVARAKAIEELITKSEFANARWGIIAVSLKDGRVTVAKDAQKLFNPASIQKLITSVVALDKLGGDFRWQTKVLAEKEIEADGTLNGDLILYGEGSPDFDAEGLKKIIETLQAKGLKRVKGRIIGDESYFKGDSFGDGWTWNEVQWYYGTEASALTFNENQTTVSLNNGKPTVPTKFVETSGEVKPIEDLEAVGLKKNFGENKVYVWGNGKNLSARIAVSNPALWAAQGLKEALEGRGISVEGNAQSSDWREEKNRGNLKELAKIESQTLAQIVRKMNKDSVNLYAELILRTLGKKFGETAPDENPKMQKLRGDDSAGASVIKKWLLEKNISGEEITIHDGSGLSRLDFVTPEALARTLIFANQSKFSEVFKDSLPIAGIDGTLRGRLKGKNILAKTGSITYVNSLAGFVNANGESFAFAVICNNETRKNDSSPIIDSIVAELID